MDKERINYVVTENGTYVGSFVNHPIVVEGEDFEDMQQSASIVFEAYLNALKDMWERGDCFEFQRSDKL